MTEIQKRIEAEIPRLRRDARALAQDAMGADDLVQECLSRALSKLYLWREGTNLRAWLFTILHNQYVNHVRSSIRTGTPVEFDEAAPAMSQSASQEKRVELRDLDRALAQLPTDQRAVILLIGLEGMPYAEVGTVLGIPVGTVRSRLSRGRESLRDLMGLERRQSKRQETRARTPRRATFHLSSRTEGSARPAVAG
jgi:RNA polymerase sigma-70 factor, ECF subfamily